MTQPAPKYRKLYGKISVSPEALAGLERIKRTLTAAAGKPVSYSTVVLHLLSEFQNH